MTTATMRPVDIRPGDEPVVLQLPPYQFGFLTSTARYPALVSAIGTGKTRMALTKIWNYCDENPQSLWIVVRKEFRDLQDSTMPDFEKYFGVKINSNRNYDFPNGSRIMFRHGEEVESGDDTPNVLKNLNLSGFMIEQAEEFKTERTFVFLRDRLRREAMPYHQGIIIANVAGHNWIYKIWKRNAYNDRTRYPLFEATTFDNRANLPAAFILDLETMKTEAPAHFRRYVLNDWDEEEGVDILIPSRLVEASFLIDGLATGGKAIVCDPARFGDDDTVITIFQRIDDDTFAQIHAEEHKGWSTMQTVGRQMEILRSTEGVDVIINDSNGLGGGVHDRIVELSGGEMREVLKDVALVGYNGGEAASNKELYINKRAEDAWLVKDILTRQQLRLLNIEKQTNQFPVLEFGFRSNGKRYIIPKEELRKKGIKSPGHADCVLMFARHRQILSAAKEMVSPQVAAAKQFWQMVKADKERTQGSEEGWHTLE